MTRARDLAAFVSNADGDIKFDTDTLFIDSSTNRVGIGTTSPSEELHIATTGGATAGIQIGTAGGTVDRDYKIIVSSSAGSLFIQDTTASVNRIALNSSGNVGIGLAASIGAALHVDPATNVTTALGSPLIKVGGANSWAGSGSLYSIGLGYVNADTNKSPTEIGVATTSGAGFTKGDLVFATRDVTTDTAPTERWRITSEGHFKASSDGLGIDFSATEGSGVSSSILDDYEEGTFTPTLSIGGVTLASTSGSGRYTKIGRKVYIEGTVTRNTASGGSGTIIIHGLPYTCSAADSIGVMGAGTFWMDQGNASTDTVAHAYVAGGNTYVQGVRGTSTGARASDRYANASELTNGRPIYFNFSYVAA